MNLKKYLNNMLQDNFKQRKIDVLSKTDKSSIGKFDKKIISLCRKINKNGNYYTTSSCAGRVVVMLDSEVKAKGLFLWVSHGLINLKKFKNELRKIKTNRLINFKQEPCILHVACRGLDDAQKLLDKAKLAGSKKSGIISSGKRFVCELNSTEKLEFPIMKSKKFLVDDDFLRLIVKRSNENINKSWIKIEKLEKLL